MKTAKKSVVFKTFSPKQQELKSEWLLIDVKGKTLGRVANKIADLLRGKGKPTYSQHVIAGDYVIVINAAEVKLTGKKETDKEYNWHSRFPGGLKTVSPQEMRAKHPERMIEYAVAGMLPHNKLKKQLLKKLKVFSGAEHDMAAQNPRSIEL